MVCSRCPKECRFYETVLKRKCFKKLQNNVWECKTKWVSIRKADNHHRQKILYKYMNLWMIYLCERYRKKINRRTTDAHYEEKLKARALFALKRNVEQNRMLLRICDRKFELSLKYRCWHRWKHYVQLRLKVREVKTLADRIREERLIIRFFYLLLFFLNEKRLFKDSYKLAIAKHETKLKEKCFKYWKIFTKKQICKTKIEKLAIACYKDKLKEKYIRCWRRYTSQKKLYKYHVSVIKNFYECYLIKKFLNQWWIAYRNLEHKNQIYKLDLAVTHHDRKLLVKSFNTLWKVRTVTKLKDEKVRKFNDIYIKVYLDVWLEKRAEKIVWNDLEHKATKWRKEYLRELFIAKLLDLYQERIDEKEEMENVIKYCNAIITHRAFRAWRKATDYKIEKKVQLENARRIYIEKLTKKSFEKWRKYTIRRFRKKMAAEYYRFILLLRIITEWRIFLRKRKQKLAEAVMLERKYNTNLLKNAFECWKNETMSSKSKLTAAIHFNYRLSLSKAFWTWRKNTRLKTVKKPRYNRNKAILNDIIVKNAILRWYKMLSVNQNFKKKLQELKSNREKRVLASYFSIWRAFVEKMKCVNQNVGTFTKIRWSILLEQYLINLLEAVKSKRVLNKKEELAEKIEEKLVKRKYLRKWLAFICWKREKMQSCVSEERKFNSRDGYEFFIPVGKTTRRQPMIPKYLKAEFFSDEFQEEDTINQKTYRVEQPVNKHIPIIGFKESFVSFDV